jgi:thermopsin
MGSLHTLRLQGDLTCFHESQSGATRFGLCGRGCSPRLVTKRAPYPFVVILIASIAVVSSAVFFAPSDSHPAVSASASPNVLQSSPRYDSTATAGSPPNDGVVQTSTARAAGIAAARTAFLAAGGNLSHFSPPSINAPVRPASATGGHVVPLYDETPAPMGIATYGLRNTSGQITPYVLNTTSVEGAFSTSDPTGVQVQSYDLDGQTTFGAQLNAIEVGTTLAGQTSFRGNENEFWLQNTLSYNPEATKGQLTFDFEIWNFSYNNQANLPWAGFSILPTNSILHGNGQDYGDEVYDSGGGPIISVAYPFTLQLYLNTTVGSFDGSPPVNEVYVNYSVWNSAGKRVCPTSEWDGEPCGEYDNVYFNSKTPVLPGSAEIQANGYHYASDGNGTNLDIEFDFGIGNYNAAIADTVYADATLGLLTLNASTGRYQEVPSAYDFGSETGETTQGSYGTWTVGANGAPLEHLTTGPSLLTGLWNVSSGPGAHALSYRNVEPQNAWVAIAPGRQVTNQMIFHVDPTFGWFNRPTAGGELGPNTWLQPGIYTVEVMLSGYDTVTRTVDLTAGNVDLSVHLTRDLASPTYTPLYAFSNTQLASIATSGAGTPTSPYRLWDSQDGSIAPVFGDLSQWPYEVWEGIYVNATTAHAEWAPLPSLSITYPWWELQFLYTAPFTAPLPVQNQLQIFLYHTQNLTIYGSPNVGGWFAYSATTGYNLIAKGVRNVLIADNHFNFSNLGIEFTGKGGNNTIWGNTFTPVDLAATYGVYPPQTALAVEESGDRIYNNAFYTSSPAVSGDVYTDYWNVTCVPGFTPAKFLSGAACEPLSYSQVVNGYALSGSILGTSYQGGNFWLNYGNNANPYGNVPYENVGSIVSGPRIGGIATGKGDRGDYAPLILFRLHELNFAESGLPMGTSWNVSVTNSTGYRFVSLPSHGTTLNFYLPPGTYTYAAPSMEALGRWYAASDPTGSILLSSIPVTIPLSYAQGHLVTFEETGLPMGATWWANITGQPSAQGTVEGPSAEIQLGLRSGTYYYAVGVAPRFIPSPTRGSFVVNGKNAVLSVVFTRVTYAVTFMETGLPTGTPWTVTAGSKTHTMTGMMTTFRFGNGSYPYTVTTPAGYAANPAAGSFTVAGGAPAGITVPFGPAHAVRFTESGLPLSQGFQWSLSVAGQVPASSTTHSITMRLPDGTYAYSISSSSTYPNYGGTSSTGYSPTPATGSFTVDGGSVTKAVQFSPTLWSVTFVETGLPHGRSWQVTIIGGAGAVSLSSSNSTITFRLVNGTYGYVIAHVPGFTTTPTGSFLVWGTALTLEVAFDQ